MVRRITGARTVQCLLAAAALGLCALPLWSQDDGSATVITLSGQVSWLKDGIEPWVLNLNDRVPIGRTIVTGPDGYAVFRVADGSTFEIFPNSKTEFRRSRANWIDILDVWIGHIKVHVQHFADRPNPNNVRTPTAVISVRGTIFDVDVRDDAGTTFITVDEGVVQVENRTAPGPALLLHKDESITVFPGTPLARVVDKSGIYRGVLRAAEQALYEAIYRRPPGSASTTGTPLPGDPGKKAPPSGPPPAAPPPPPPPPPPPNFLPAGLVTAGSDLRLPVTRTVEAVWTAAQIVR